MFSRLFLSRLNLKVKASIILLCNLYPALKNWNKTYIIITQLKQYYIEVHILDREFQGQLYPISRIKLMTIKSDMPYILT